MGGGEADVNRIDRPGSNLPQDGPDWYSLRVKQRFMRYCFLFYDRGGLRLGARR